ncbi:Carboxypeptidase Q [Acipenser ruthenus]|uniref:Carboxypeptidase Q n=1 Tax=Acipenser ruthenus TaxID=7906 RepID=A0A444U8Y5_ACIRT|nr:Carboxypeptidase Q [Acipenser ruthenus]
MVLWTVEEQGGVGVEQYYQLHKINISNFDLVMESDTGTFAPFGLQFTGSSKTQAIMKRVRMLLQPISVTGLSEHGEGTLTLTSGRKVAYQTCLEIHTFLDMKK